MPNGHADDHKCLPNLCYKCKNLNKTITRSMSAVLKPNDITLRPMGEADLDAVNAIEQATYPFPWTRGIFSDCIRVGYSCWVLEEAGQVLACGVMSAGGGEAHILTIVVKEDYRQQGLGRRLLVHLMSIAKKRDTETIFLEVRPSNVAAIQLYQSLGFSEIGIRKDYYPAENGREDALVMGLDKYQIIPI